MHLPAARSHSFTEESNEPVITCGLLRWLTMAPTVLSCPVRQGLTRVHLLAQLKHYL